MKQLILTIAFLVLGVVNALASINVVDKGADPNGTQDSTAAFKSAISSCPSGGKIIVPAGTYLVSSTLVIDKPLSFIGDNAAYQSGSYIKWRNITDGSVYALNITVPGVVVDGVYLKNESSAAYGLIVSANSDHINWNQTIRNVWIEGFAYGFYSPGGLLLSEFDHVFAYNCSNGFFIDNSTGANSTSLTFRNCWAWNCTGIWGFYFNNVQYSSLISCACDGLVPSPQKYAYGFSNCSAIGLYNCGAEQSGAEHIFLANTSEFTAIGFFGYHGNIWNSGDGAASLLFSDSDSKNITLIGCKDYAPYNGVYSVYSAGISTLISCDLSLNAFIHGGFYLNDPGASFGKFININ